MSTLKGIFPDLKPTRRKNFIHENVKNLRRMEQCFHANKDMVDLQKLQLHSPQKCLDKYQNVTARVNTSFREKRREDAPGNMDVNKKEQQPRQKNSAPMLNKKPLVSMKKPVRPFANNNILNKQKKRDRNYSNETQQVLRAKSPSDPNVVHKQNEKSNDDDNTEETPKYRSQGIQTLDEKDMDGLYTEGVIRYPTKRETKHNELSKNELDHQVDKGPNEQSNPPSDRGDVYITEDTQNITKNFELPHEEVDYVKLNKERNSVASKFATQLNNGIPPTNYRKGVVPKYIRDRKEAQQKEQKAKAEASQSDCPEGHVSLPDQERKETLRMLKKNYQDYVNELNMMPIKTDTLRSQRRKIEIEKQLNKLEEAIKVFSRPKVFVKVNA